MKTLLILQILLITAVTASCQTSATKSNSQNTKVMDTQKIVKTDEQWKKELTPEQYHVLREKGTEPAYKGEYTDNFKKGKYACAGCGTVLFTSDSKFESHCGWPSFDNDLGGDRVIKKPDNTFGMMRTEILCAKCGGHLGHIFDDGPTATGNRYCVNSISIKFIPEEK